LDADDSAWPAIAELVEGSTRATVLSVDRADAADCLYRLQVTTRSVLGALALNTGGLVIDHGWLRILGGGHSPLPWLAAANGLGPPSDSSQAPPRLQVARDVLGGQFAINGGDLPGSVGKVCYFAPDTLVWQPLEVGHGDFVAWTIGSGTDEFYADLRWSNWQRDAEALGLDEGLSVFPPLFARHTDGRDRVSRRAIPWDELTAFHDDMAAQVRDLPDGTPFRIQVTDDD